MTNEMNGAGLLRMIGVMAICVSAVWILQILAFGEGSAALSRMTWILGAATIAGAGAGLVFVSSSLPDSAEA